MRYRRSLRYQVGFQRLQGQLYSFRDARLTGGVSGYCLPPSPQSLGKLRFPAVKAIDTGASGAELFCCHIATIHAPLSGASA